MREIGSYAPDVRRYEDPPLVTHGKASEVLEAALTAGEPALNPHAVLSLGHLARRFRFLGPESVDLVKRLGRPQPRQPRPFGVRRPSSSSKAIDNTLSIGFLQGPSAEAE